MGPAYEIASIKGDERLLYNMRLFLAGDKALEHEKYVPAFVRQKQSV